MKSLSPAAPLAVADADLEDYDLVRRAIAFISQDWRDQPEADAIAHAVGITSDELTQLFRRWAGLTPKAFLQAVTLDHTRRLLDGAASVLDTAYEAGLSGPGRLHDLFVTHEAMSPGEYKSGGAGLTIHFGFHPCPFGEALVMTTARGLCGLAFADPGAQGNSVTYRWREAESVSREASLDDMRRRWPRATYVEDHAATQPVAARIFHPDQWRQERPLRVFLIGADFEVRVWETLLKIPLGSAATYSGVAAHMGSPKAARAVGAAVGKNPVSFVVPCHRVLGKSGALTGYHWGVTRKRAMLGWERGINDGLS